MNTLDFKQEHSKEILEFEKETGKHAILYGRVTGNFKLWLSKRNNYLFNFFLNYFQEHHYTTKKQMVAFYIQKKQPSEEELIHTQKKVGTVIRQYVKIGILEKYSKISYKINKIVLRDFYAIGN